MSQPIFYLRNNHDSHNKILFLQQIQRDTILLLTFSVDNDVGANTALSSNCEHETFYTIDPNEELKLIKRL